MSTTCDVIIIGAGIAGISCANKLREEGINNIILLEGRDRLGGRVRTDYDLFGIPMDLGASWLHGFEHTTLTKLAVQHGVALEEKKESKAVLFDAIRGEIDIMEFVEVSERIQQFFEHIKPRIQKEEGVTIRSAISLFPSEYERLLYTSAELENASLRAQKDRLIEFCLQEIEVYNASNVEYMSALSVDSFDPSGDKHVIDGYNKLINALSKGLDVRTRHIVSKIEYNSRGNSKQNVVVTTDKGTFTAGYCCVTLPLGVLKADKVVFSPPLPARKRGAIDRIGFGLMDKIILQYSEPLSLWEKDTDYIGLLPHPASNNKNEPLNHTFGWMYNLDTLFPGSATYVWYVSGDYAEYLESLTNTEVAQIATAELELVRNSIQKAKNVTLPPLPKLVKCRVTRWKQDQFCLGAYSYVHTNTLPGDFEMFAEPLANCITFAGEGTSSKQYGMVNCAFDTGLTAATTIAKWLKSSHSKL